MDILVLVRPVPEAETRLRPNSAGTTLDSDGVRWVLAGYDESAVEQALLLKETVAGSTVRVLSFAPTTRAEEVVRASLALGCDAGTVIEQDPTVAVDPVTTARVLAAVAQRYRFDLLLTGKQAGDDEAGIVGPALGELLGVVDFAPVIDLRWQPNDQRFAFQVALEGGSDGIRAAPPLVLGLQQAWNDPRTARLPNILKSRRATLDRVPWSEVAPVATAAPPAAMVGFRLPPPRTGAKMIDYKEPDEAARKLVQVLVEEAKVLP